MNRIISSFLALNFGWIPAILLLAEQPVWGQTQNSQREEAQKLIKKALRQSQQGQLQQAIETLRQVLVIGQELKDRELEADAFFWIGSVYYGIGQPQKALEYYNQALPISRQVRNHSTEAKTLNGIAGVYYGIGQPQKALEYYNQALPISRQVHNRSTEVTTLNNIGLVYDNIGQPQKALDYYNQSLLISRQVGDRIREATTLNNIGVVYDNIGQSQKALDYYNQSLSIKHQVGDHSGEATTLNNVGLVYDSIGQPQQALKFYNQSLLISRQMDDRPGEATTLSNIGVVYDSIGQPQQALKFYNQSLLISRQAGDRSQNARTLNNLGKVYDNIGQPQQALDYYNQSLPILRQVGDRLGEATVLSNIGSVYDRIRQPQQALRYYNQSLPISRQVGDRPGEAKMLGNIGMLYRNTNRSAEAITNLEQSLNIILEIRRGLIKENRQEFLQAERGSAVALTDFLINQNQPDRAYELVNLATTFDLADYTRLLNAKVPNLAAQRAIDQWNQQTQQLQLLRQRLQDNFSEVLSRQIRDLEAQVNQQAEAISRQFPEVAELFETTPTNIAQLRASIPPGTTVIHPILLTNVSNVPNTIAIFVLTRDKLTVTKTAITPVEFDILLTQTYAQLINRYDERFLDNSAKLYALLIRPVEAQIQATKPIQVSIIATGKLRYIPFETLYDSKADRYLIQKYPINYLTRLSTYSLQARAGSSSSPPKVLALGNPIPTKLLALDGADAEVESITQLLPGSEAFIREKATLDTFKTQAFRFPFIHLATHGCFQVGGCSQLGLEENTILFSDRRLNIADAALLGLQNTDLITLSACQTALEANSNGEEIAGLAYLFERAGARSVIASLWSTEDKTTQEIMVQFYKNLKHGMGKSEALRQAKLSQIDSHPFFWSPFILIGEAR